MRRLLVAVLALGLIGGLVGCSDDGDGDDTATDTATETTDDGAGAETTTTFDPDEGLFLDEGEGGLEDMEGDEDEFPCNIIDQAQVDEIFGPSDDRLPPSANPLNVVEDGEEWTAAECSWSSVGDAAIDPDVPPDASIQISQADDFAGGEVLCPDHAGVPLDGLGDSAQWDWTDPGTTLTVGYLRVCTPDALIDVRAGGVDGEASLQAIAVALAEAAIAAR